jgi:hypothetical protein
VRRKRITPEIEQVLDNEAYRRFRGDPLSERTTTKKLAFQWGFARGYFANIIARKRRAYEQKVNITAEMSTHRPEVGQR